MKVLMFHAASTAVAAAVMTRIANALREEGHSVGERNLPAFKAEKEPADKVMVLLNETQARVHQDRGVELAGVFGFLKNNDNDVAVLVELPGTDAELQELDIDSIVGKIDGPPTATMSMDQAKAEAIERGLEVTAETTKLDLERMLGTNISEAVQAADRRTDQVNNQNLGEQRIGVRTSTVLPSVNGLDLERMNDEQLKAAASQLGLTVSANVKRETLIKKLQKTYANRVGAPEDAGAKTGTAATDPGSSELPSSETNLPSLDGVHTHAELDKLAAAEGVEFERSDLKVEEKREAILAKRNEVKAHG